MNQRTLCRKFAELELDENKKLTASSLFAEGNTIYSYGYHFPIAYKTSFSFEGKPIVFFNANNYSITTSKHKSYVLGALSSYLVVRTQHIQQIRKAIEQEGALPKEEQTVLLDELENRLDEYRAKYKRARTEHSKEYYHFLQKQELDELQAVQTIA